MKSVLIRMMLLMMMVWVLPSCTKQSDTPADKGGVKPADTTVTKPQTPAAETKPADATPAAPAAPVAPAAPAVAPAAAGMVALDIKLPNPMFQGTPTNLQVTNLEKPLGRPRDPFLAPEGAQLISKGKPVSGEEPIFGDLAMITDGDKDAADGSYVQLGPMKQDIVIDLEGTYEIYAILVWHFHKQATVYFDVIAQISEDKDFIQAATVYNNDVDNSAQMGVGTDKNYIETSEGRLIDAKGTKGRYIKMSSGGNNANDLNHYIEVEVWGKPVK